MEALEMLQTRRSVRKFKEELLPRDVINQIIEAASYAPSWKNAQPSRYYLLENEATLKQLAETCTMDFQWNEKLVKQTKQLIIQTVVSGRSGYERDGSPSTSKGSHFESFDAGLSAENFCLAAHAYGAGTCILGIFDEAKIKALLKLPEEESVTALILIGIPDEEPVMPKRKTAEQLLKVVE